MTARSELGHYVRGYGARIATNTPADTAAARGLVNNANHLLDERGGYICNLAGDWKSYESDEGSSAWHQLYAFPSLIYIPTRLSSGRSASVVARARLRAQGGGTATFRLVVSPWRGSGRPTTVGDSCAEIVVTSDTAADYDFAPIFIRADDLLATGPLSPAIVSMLEHPAIDGTGVEGGMRTLLAQLTLWTRGSSLSRCYGISAREYIGG